MVFQVRGAKFRLREAALRSCGGQFLRRYDMIREQPVQRRLLGDEAFTNRYGLSLHGFEHVASTASLRVGKTESVGKLQQMAGTRIAIQFRRERQTHAAPGAQIRDLLI